MNEEYINFDSFSKDYDFTRAISDESLQLVFNSFQEVNNSDRKFKNVLEIGCGTGRITKIFAMNDFKVTGVDISKSMIDLALEKSLKEHWDFTAVVADARNLPFKDNQFDIALAVHVLTLIKDWKKVIAEALRCSKTKRFVSIDVERVIFPIEIMSQYWTYLHNLEEFSPDYEYKKLGAQSSKEIIEFMSSEGFECIRKDFESKTFIKCDDLIKIIKSKSFLAQMNIPQDLHEKAFEFLKEHQYFLPKSDTIEISEKGKLLNFFKRNG